LLDTNQLINAYTFFLRDEGSSAKYSSMKFHPAPPPKTTFPSEPLWLSTRRAPASQCFACPLHRSHFRIRLFTGAGRESKGSISSSCTRESILILRKKDQNSLNSIFFKAPRLNHDLREKCPLFKFCVAFALLS